MSLGPEITVIRTIVDDYISLTDIVHNIENGNFYYYQLAT